jgi:hypothetical protein
MRRGTVGTATPADGDPVLDDEDDEPGLPTPGLVGP